jgi:hypothetical protein
LAAAALGVVVSEAATTVATTEAKAAVKAAVKMEVTTAVTMAATMEAAAAAAAVMLYKPTLCKLAHSKMETSPVQMNKQHLLRKSQPYTHQAR